MPTESAAWGCSPQARETQAEAGLVQHDIGDDQQYDGNGRGEVKILEDQRVPEGLAFNGSKAESLTGDAGPAGDLNGGQALALDCPGQNNGKRRSELVEGRAADGLVRLEVDGRKGQEQREDHAAGTGNQDCTEHGKLRMFRTETALVKRLQRETGEQGADDHHAFQGDVDDAGMLREHAAQCNQQKRHRKQDGQTDNICKYDHFFAASFCLRLPNALEMTPRISRANAAR